MKQTISVVIAILLFFATVFFIDGVVATVLCNSVAGEMSLLAISGTSSLLAFALFTIFIK